MIKGLVKRAEREQHDQTKPGDEIEQLILLAHGSFLGNKQVEKAWIHYSSIKRSA
jgi:hypothetical protein